MEQHYSNDVDFFCLFEADTFDVEEYEDGNFRGYVYGDSGEKLLAGTFDYDGKNSGTGWYDDTLI